MIYMENKHQYILNKITELFPDAKCELNYNNHFELLISVVLSAQTTDKKVNMVTPQLFSLYPDSVSLSLANVEDVIDIIKPLGLSQVKAKNIINLSRKLTNDTGGLVPSDFDYLVTLPGVGVKTANVMLAEGFNIPAIAVDTHVLRIANRLGLSNSSNVDVVERDLKNTYDKSQWCDCHIKLLFFGRYLCKSKNPNCVICPFNDKDNKICKM